MTSDKSDRIRKEITLVALMTKDVRIRHGLAKIASFHIPKYSISKLSTKKLDKLIFYGDRDE